MIDKIAAIVKFNYTISEADDGHFGSIDSNGEWTGIIRELMDKRADIGLTSLSVMAERENVIDFTVPFYDWVGLSIMMMRPSTTPSLFKFLSVLETTVWLCVLAAFFLARFVLLNIDSNHTDPDFLLQHSHVDVWTMEPIQLPESWTQTEAVLLHIRVFS